MSFIIDNYLGHAVEGIHVSIWVYSRLKGCLTTTRLAILTSLHIVERPAANRYRLGLYHDIGFSTMIYEQVDTSTPLYAAVPNLSHSCFFRF